MAKIREVLGERFGRLVVVKRVPMENTTRKMYLCKCDCGKEIITSGTSLRIGASTSCGCYKVDRTKEVNTKHGKKKTRLFKVWLSIKNRCSYTNGIGYKYYGGRGITVCDEWLHDFQAFYDWSMANGYKEEISPNGRNRWTIDRIDNNKGYSPDNCRWVTIEVQANNKTTNHFVEYNGEKLTLSQIAKRYNIEKSTLRYRLKYGWDIQKAVSTVPQSRENNGN